jgi:hypothetical protein
MVLVVGSTPQIYRFSFLTPKMQRKISPAAARTGAIQNFFHP